MKKLFLVLLFMMFTVSAYSANLAWDASTGQVDGYNVYFTDGTESFNADVGNVVLVEDIDNTFNLNPGKTYIFTVTAYNIMGESGLSNSASYDTADSYTPPETWNIPIKKEKPGVVINLNFE